MSGVVLRAGSARDRDALTALLARLTPASSYARFNAALGPEPPAYVVDAMLPCGARGGAVLAWDGADLVAHGEWVRLGLSPVAEVALVVADSHQGRGLGTALAEQVVAAAGAHGVEQIEMFTATANRAIARMVAHLGSDIERRRDGASVTYSFTPRRPARAGTAA
jgi:GNAT superfamily N-acetyltransferase